MRIAVAVVLLASVVMAQDLCPRTPLVRDQLKRGQARFEVTDRDEAWLIADDLCARGEYAQARAFVQACDGAPPALRDYIDRMEKAPAPLEQRVALAAAKRLRHANHRAEALQSLAGIKHEPNVVCVLAFQERCRTYHELDRKAESDLEALRGAAVADSFGWRRRNVWLRFVAWHYSKAWAPFSEPERVGLTRALPAETAVLMWFPVGSWYVVVLIESGEAEFTAVFHERVSRQAVFDRDPGMSAVANRIRALAPKRVLVVPSDGVSDLPLAVLTGVETVCVAKHRLLDEEVPANDIVREVVGVGDPDEAAGLRACDRIVGSDDWQQAQAAAVFFGHPYRCKRGEARRFGNARFEILAFTGIVWPKSREARWRIFRRGASGDFQRAERIADLQKHARYVLVSQWKHDARIERAFHEAFFSAWRMGKTPSEAAHAARMWVRSIADDPRHWGGWQLWGPGPPPPPAE